ncbi:MAG: phosphoribosylformylglycinamidine cyclo-ligase [Chloroflexi bacterium]|nr:phosphoribosylformylglycinamidine cyclo-ligase [Chloroflexota bacterium]
MSEDKLDYKRAGVDYSRLDPLKVMAQQAARDTARHLLNAGFQEVAASRGESAYVIDMGDFYLASITECLGTKSLVADAMREIGGRTYYDQIAQDTIAAAANDLATVGARPLSIHAYWAVGGSEWFDDERRMRDLVQGWKATCDALGAAWGGGETPSLAGIVQSGTIDLAASCVGIIRPKEHLVLGEALRPGDAIVLLASSGIHANGLTLARKLAERLPQGYATPLPEGRLYGEALLDATTLYSPVVQALLAAGIDIHYMANITGHGWRKIMRHPAAFTYRIASLPPVPPVLRFLAQQAGLGPDEAYGTLNMGAGYALFLAAEDAQRAIEISQAQSVPAYLAGRVESGPRRVLIEPLNVLYDAASLDLRG